MFDTMKMTKAVGGVCGSLLVFLLIGWGAEILFTHGEGGEAEGTQAYSIATDEAPAGDAAAAEEGPAFAEVYATADAAAGEKVFGKCKSCHNIDGKNATGPHLNGVVGRERASVADFAYSDAMAADHAPWTPELLEAFLTNPKAYVKGTKMSFAGLPKVQDRANVIAFLATKQ